MENIKIKKTEGKIEHVFESDKGYTYLVNTEKSGLFLIAALNYTGLSEFISREFGARVAMRVGKKITLVEDDTKLLGIISPNNDICFLPDEITYDFKTIRFTENESYIEKKYNLSKEEFLILAKQKDATLKLGLK